MEYGRKKLGFEVLLDRYFSNFLRILLTNLLFAVPSAIFFTAFYMLSVTLFNGGINIPIMLLTIIPLYPFYAGVVMVCRNIARGDEGVPVVRDYLKAVKENFLPFLLHGVFVYAVAMLSALGIQFYAAMLSAGWFFYVLLFFSALIALLLLYAIFYIPLMNITYDLPLRYVYKNSLLMSFGEIKNNFFATMALAVVFAICLTVVAFSGSAMLWILLGLWVLLLPATCTFMYVYFIYDGMTNIIRNKDEKSREVNESIQKNAQRLQKRESMEIEEEDFSDIDVSSLKDTDDYIFHNGRMVKQSTLLRMIREREEQNNSDKTSE